MTRNLTCATFLLLAMPSWMAPALAQVPLDAAFTYQCKLNQSGNPLNAAADFQFTLWDAPTLGNQLGSAVAVNNVTVANGLFTVSLNALGEFGPSAFNGDARWLQIAVRSPAGSGTFTTLSPRQPLTAAPYALQTRGIFVNHVNNVGIGTTNPVATLDIVGSAPFPHLRIAARDDSSTPYGSFLSLDATATTGGKDWLIYSTGGSAGEGPGNLIFRNFTDDGPAITFDTAGRVGIGKTTPFFRLDVVDSSGSAVISGTTTVAQAWGVRGSNQSSGALGVLGYGSTGIMGKAGAEGYAAQFFGNVYCVTGSVGIGTATPAAKLDVVSSTTAVQGTGDEYGVNGISYSEDGVGVRGTGLVGVQGFSNTANVYPSAGVEGYASSSSANSAGVAGFCENSPQGCGVYAELGDRGFAAILAQNGINGGYAGYFLGPVYVAGTLTKSGGSFKIDHPTDPANKYLSHSFVESPDMMNVYNGNVTTDAKGYATVKLPDWFESLNRDFRYQLTVIDTADSDAFVQAKITREISGNQFALRTSQPNTRVSWQVTGIRHDPWAEANRIPVEQEKTGQERGRYIFPKLYGKPVEKGIEALRPRPRPEKARQALPHPAPTAGVKAAGN